MKKQIIVLTSLLALSGCSKGGGTTGTIECQSIYILSSYSSSSSASYSYGKKDIPVYEYTFEGNNIYCDLNDTTTNGKLTVWKDKNIQGMDSGDECT